MIVRIAKSTKMPVLWSYYVSKFTDETLEQLKASKPFASYNKATQEYEVTEDIYNSIIEPVCELVDERTPFKRFVRLSTEPFGYQEDAVRFAQTTDNIFVNFAQGMGKTLTAMKIINSRGLKKVLVICGQGNLQEEWLKDGIKHNYKDKLNMRIVGDDTGAGNAKKIKWLKDTISDRIRLDLINIEALRSVDIVYWLNCIEYDCIVVDEVQSAKGWKAEQTQGLHELVRHNKQVRIALSGTPVLNDPLEFFSMLKYFNMLENTARTTFEKYYGVWSFDCWGHYVCVGYKNLEALNELIAPIVCCAKKDELNLPLKRRVRVNLTPSDAQDYWELKKVYKMSAARLKKAGYETKPQVRAEMQYISSTMKEKIDFVFNRAKQSKVLVFSQYTTVLEKYRDELENRGLKVLYYHGKLSMKERLSVLEAWRKGEGDVLLLSIMTARYGLNLTEATETIFLEPPTSLAILEQAEDRAHRIGQDRPVTSYLLVSTEMDADALNNIVVKQEALDKLAAMRG